MLPSGECYRVAKAVELIGHHASISRYFVPDKGSFPNPDIVYVALWANNSTASAIGKNISARPERWSWLEVAEKLCSKEWKEVSETYVNLLCSEEFPRYYYIYGVSAEFGIRDSVWLHVVDPENMVVYCRSGWPHPMPYDPKRVRENAEFGSLVQTTYAYAQQHDACLRKLSVVEPYSSAISPDGTVLPHGNYVIVDSGAPGYYFIVAQNKDADQRRYLVSPNYLVKKITTAAKK